MSINLPEELTEFLHAEVSSGRFASVDAVVEEALRALQAERADAIAGVRRGVASMERGEGIPLDEAIATLKSRVDSES